VDEPTRPAAPISNLPEPPLLEVGLLGGFRVVVGDRAIEPEHWRRRKVRHLIQILALAGGRMHRDQVLDQLWPDLAPGAAANNLHQTLHHARRALDPGGSSPLPFLQIRSDQVHLAPEEAVSIDVAAFAAAARAAQGSPDPSAYRAALDRYTGDLLPDEPYVDWATGRREDLRRTYLGLLLELARLQEARHEDEAAIATLRRIIEADAIHEGANLALMRLYARRSRRQQALRQYQVYEERLRAELGAAPDPKIRRLYQAILDGHYPPERPAETEPGLTASREEKRRPGPIENGPPEPRPAISHNLPHQLTGFVGRERELAELQQLLGRARLITLTGPGGCGKTRLALEVGGALLTSYPDGVWLVDLAPLFDPDLVPRAVSKLFGIRESADQPVVAALIESLRARCLLLILDNCEHILDACAHLADALLRSCPRVRILATSREGLGVAGELLWPVSSLALPPEGAVAVDQIGAYAAVRLFVERAGAARPGFGITTVNAPVIAQVCRRLDGIPLALELAAARLQALSIDQLLARLDQSFRLLTGGSRVALARQQTLAATVGWSYDLLTSTEQTLFNRLAVFVGGFTIDLAEAVCSDGDDVLDLLLRLVGKSLVVAETDDGGGDRYRLLETLRQYAKEKLQASGESEEIGRRHAEAYLAMAAEAEPELRGSKQVVWFDRLDREHNNLRAAFEWLAARSRWVDALRLAVATSRFWIIRGFYTEGHERLTSSLNRMNDPSQVLLQAKAYRALGTLASRQGDYSEGDRCWEVCIRLATEAGDRPLLVDALTGSAVSAVDYVSPGLAQSRLEQALVIARELALTQEVGQILVLLGFLAVLREDLAEAEAHFSESLAILHDVGDAALLDYGLFLRCGAAAVCGDYRRLRAVAEEYQEVALGLGDRGGQANSLVHLAHAAWAEGDLGKTQALLTQALTIYRDIGDFTGVAWAVSGLSRTYLHQRDVERARALVDEGLALVRRYGDHAQLSMMVLRAAGDVALARGEVETAASYYQKGLVLLADQWLGVLRLSLIEGMAEVAATRNQPVRAAHLAAAVAAEWKRLGATPPPLDLEWLDQMLVPARASLTEQAWTAAWVEGQAMTLKQAIAEALIP
jgi:predicted ATPase/DNA-binding SARP family transcriptional activator